MPITFTVPESVRSIAERTLQLHQSRKAPLDDVHGVKIAEALSGGSVSADIVSAIHRYFAINERHYQNDTQRMLTEETSSVVRSYLLHGAEAGKAWAEKAYKKAVKQGAVAEEATSLMALFELRPEDIYPRFSMGAWRYEYGLDPRSASRFVEHYQMATGLTLDLTKAFGKSAHAVGNAIYRRFHTPNPFQELYRAMMVEDTDYRLAAHLDLQVISRALTRADALEESLAKSAFTSPAASKKLPWAAFVAYFILAVEDPDELKAMNADSLKVPTTTQKPKGFTAYNDAINTHITFFHPDGVRYEDPSQDKKFSGVGQDVRALMQTAYFGKSLKQTVAIKTLTRAYQWLAKHKLVTTLFNLLIQDWKKGNWQHILDNIPEDADVKIPFANFVTTHTTKPPKDGTAMQQKPASKADKSEVNAYMGEHFPDASTIAVDHTQFAADAEAAGTPVGIHSIISGTGAGITAEILAAIEDAGDKGFVVRMRGGADDGNLEYYSDAMLSTEFQKGNLTVLQGHKSLSGTKYGAPEEVPDPNTADKSNEITTYMKEVYEDNFDLFKQVPLAKTLTGGAIKTILKATPKDGMKLLNVNKHWVFTLERAYTSAQGALIITRDDEGELDDYNDEDVAELIEGGKLKLVSGGVGVGQPEKEPAIDYMSMPDTSLMNYLEDEGGFDPESTAKVNIKKTKFYKVVTAAGDNAAEGSWWKHSYYLPMKLLGAYTDEDGDNYIVWQQQDGNYYHELDTGAKASYEMKVLVPIDVPDNADIAAPNAIPATSEVLEAPKFSAGNVIALSGSNYQVVAMSDEYYLIAALSLAISGTTNKVSIKGTDKEAKLLYPTMPNAVDEVKALITLLPSDTWVDTPEQWGVAYSDTIVSDHTYTFIGAIDTEIAINAVVQARTSKEWNGAEVSYNYFTLYPASNFAKKVESSYAPTEPKPETTDTEVAQQMAGTQDAFDWLEKKGWKPSNKTAEFSYFWNLGDVLNYQATKQRTIIGYGIDAADKAIYVTMTEAGNISYKGAAKADVDYGPKVSTDASIIPQLKPLPGSEAVEFPKLNYHLSSEAKAIAEAQNLTYFPSPEEAPFYVGTPLRSIKDHEQKFTLAAWREGDTGVIINTEGVALFYSVGNISLLFEPDYQHKNSADPITGEVVFSKSLAAVAVPIYAGDLTLPTGPPDGWDIPTPIQQPPFQTLPAGIHVSAGVVAIVPSYKTEVSGSNVHTGVLMVYPLNEYKGYKLTFPKGTVDPGESLEKAAVRETFEEAGLTVKPVAYLGDYKGGESVTRMFIGYVTGGNPHANSTEVDATTFKPMATGLATLESVKKSSWWSLLKDRDAKIYTDAYEWVMKNGLPNDVPVDQADAPSQVSQTSDVMVTYNPKAQHAVPKSGNEKQVGLDNTVDYIIPKGVSRTVGSYAGDDIYSWEWVPASPYIQQGYPPPGVQVLFEDGVVTILGYVLITADADSGKSVIFVVVRDEVGEDAGAVNVSNIMTLKQAIDDWKTHIDPSEFEPIPTTEALKGETVPADTQADDIWNTLLFKAPFPIPTEVVTQLKAMAELVGGVPQSFSFSTALISSVGDATAQYGDNITPKANKEGAYLGSVNWATATDEFQKTYFVGLPDGTYKVHGALTPFEVDKLAKKQNTPEEPWYAIEDPDTMKIIAAIYVNGDVNSVGATVTKFKSWCKQVKMPNYAQITTNIVKPVAALFVGGAASITEKDALLKLLSARAAMSHKAKKKTASTADTVSAVGAKAVTIKPTSLDAGAIKYYVNEPQPMLFSKAGDKVPGGSKPNMLLNGPAGMQWMFKYYPDEDWRAQVDHAAYTLSAAIKGNNIPVGFMEFDGKKGSFQPFADDAKAPDSNPSTLPEEDMTELLAQHTADMFFGDHDGHVGNWLRLSNGKLRAVDRGQAFKFMFMGKKDSYDPHWHAQGNFGEGYAKRLLIQWSENQAEIPVVAFKAMRKAIGRIQALTDVTLQGVLAPIFEEKKSSPAEIKKVTTVIKKRRDKYLKDWTAVMKKLKSDFDWPAAGVAPAAPNAFSSSPDEMKFGVREDQDIQDAVSAGWQGKALRIDRDAIEDQNVMVKQVMLQKGGNKIPATMIHFRLGREAGNKASAELFKQPGLVVNETADSAEETGVIATDLSGGYWSKIHAAIKSINFHFNGEEADGKPNMGTVNHALDMAPKLQAIHKETSDPGGMYAPTNEPNEAVHLMAGQYIDYLSAIETFVTSKEPDGTPTFMGKHSPMFAQFKWFPPEDEEEEEVPKAKPALEVSYQKAGAVWPEGSIGKGGVISVAESKKAVYSSSVTPRFSIKDKNTGAEIYITPPGNYSVSGTGKTVSIPSGVEAHKGMAWAIIPGEPTPETVAHLLKIIQETTGVDTSPTTKADEDARYWSTQAASLQSGGAFKPNSDGTALVEPALVAAQQMYSAGEPEKAIKEFKKLVAKKLKVPVNKLETLPGFNPEGEYTRGAGWNRVTKINWTRDKLIKTLGAGGKMPFIVHNPTTTGASLVSMFESFSTNGALISNNMKPFYGITPKGASVNADFDKGGTQGSFAGLRRGFSSGKDHLYFDISLALRLDVYVVGKGDAFGNVNATRIFDPEKWATQNPKWSGSLGPSSHYQVNIRHDTDFQKYLYAVACPDVKSRDRIREICAAVGWYKFAQGRSIEQVVTVAGKEIA